MHAWEQIQQSLDYMEEHLNEELNIENLAHMASLSTFYYQRLFSRLVKKPVAEYLKLRRLSKATEKLVQDNRRILDIALDLGFSSHEHFTKIFKDTFGITPDEYRKSPGIYLNRMTKPELLLHYILIDEGVPLIVSDIILEINRQQLVEPVFFIGIQERAPIQLIDGLGIESGINPLDTLWRDFHEQKTSRLGMQKDAQEIGVTRPGEKQGYFNYFAGGETTATSVPEDSFSWELTPGEYIVCKIEAESFKSLVTDVLYKAEQYLFDTWLPNHRIKTEAFCAERYTNRTPETYEMSVWLKLVP